MDIANASPELERDADELLTASELIPCLEKHGQVHITGSYRYHLMTVPDIDINLASPPAGREQAGEIVTELIAQGYWRGIAFEDFRQFPREDLPSGIYLGLKRAFRGRFWKVDVWLLADMARQTAFDEAMSRLTGEQRNAIMQIKHWRREANMLSFTSRLIYEAVMSGRAWDVASFQQCIEEDNHT